MVPTRCIGSAWQESVSDDKPSCPGVSNASLIAGRGVFGDALLHINRRSILHHHCPRRTMANVGLATSRISRDCSKTLGVSDNMTRCFRYFNREPLMKQRNEPHPAASQSREWQGDEYTHFPPADVPLISVIRRTMYMA